MKFTFENLTQHNNWLVVDIRTQNTVYKSFHFKNPVCEIKKDKHLQFMLLKKGGNSKLFWKDLKEALERYLLKELIIIE